MKKKFDVLIIGSGAAGYAVAERLFEAGVTRIGLFTECVACGTSRNAGSDKQTYYKLDICSPEGDSVQRMARDLFAGGAMNGTDAYLEAANSLRCFMHLAEIGVPFPRDPYGVYHGYRTDHDNTRRATSAGPLTSRFMTERLEQRVKALGIPVFDGYTAIKLDVSGNACSGAWFLHDGKTEKVDAKATVLCTGAPAAIYENSVYPVGHRGATGLAVQAGARLQNFQEWQYGIASRKFRWNLSGSFQQVIPRYVAVDDRGNETEFLTQLPHYMDLEFLKGYEWPFDSHKLQGSSRVDVLVSEQIAAGKRVFLDYTRNPEGYDFAALNDTTRSYLQKADAVGQTPMERLLQLNPAAYELYLDHGIDLKKEYLEIGVCAQHNNGGIQVDAHGETTVKGLFAAGEASGRFGVYRPGGAALNDTQVGALLIAEYLKKSLAGYGEAEGEGEPPVLPPVSSSSTVNAVNHDFAVAMSRWVANVRDLEKAASLAEELQALLDDFENRVTVASKDEYGEYFALYGTTLARLALCRTVIAAGKCHGSRGGAVYCEKGEVIPENADYRRFLTVTAPDEVSFVPVNEIPDEEYVFEKLLKGE